MTTNDRLNKIANKRAELDAQMDAEQKKKEQIIAKYENDIKALAPRIMELITIARALIKNNIPFGKIKKGGICNKEEFITEGIEHRLGFYFEWRNGYGSLWGVGIKGGGCCGHDIVVDESGRMVKSIDPYYQSYQYDGYHDYCKKCKQFLEDFDEFEQRVNDYVDNL